MDEPRVPHPVDPITPREIDCAMIGFALGAPLGIAIGLLLGWFVFCELIPWLHR